MVRFRTGDSEYAVFISHTREVRSADGHRADALADRLVSWASWPATTRR